MIKAFISESIIKRAQESGNVTIDIVNIRDFAQDTHKTVDDRPYGGGAGMVMKVDIVHSALTSAIQGLSQRKIILTSPRGSTYNQKKAEEFSKLDQLVIICGHYEGVDDRICHFIDEEISIGDFVLTGGELAAATIIDSITRLLPGVLKKDSASVEESFFSVDINALIKITHNDELLIELKNKGVQKVSLLEYPHYTRPKLYKGYGVPEVLLSGNGVEIEEWRLLKAYELTKLKRPDLLKTLSH